MKLLSTFAKKCVFVLICAFILIVLRESIWIGYQILAYFRKAYNLTVVLDQAVWQQDLA